MFFGRLLKTDPIRKESRVENVAEPWHFIANRAKPGSSFRNLIWLRTNGVNTNGAAAKAMNFDRTDWGKRYAAWQIMNDTRTETHRRRPRPRPSLNVWSISQVQDRNVSAHVFLFVVIQLFLSSTRFVFESIVGEIVIKSPSEER